jgi:hypothetical protein
MGCIGFDRDSGLSGLKGNRRLGSPPAHDRHLPFWTGFHYWTALLLDKQMLTMYILNMHQ